jgi:hypothetical protein
MRHGAEGGQLERLSAAQVQSANYAMSSIFTWKAS